MHENMYCGIMIKALIRRERAEDEDKMNLSTLNNMQQEAVKTTEGPLLEIGRAHV